MESQQLHTLLEKLHTEIHKVESIDERELALLADLEEDLRHILVREGMPPADIQPEDIQPSLRHLLERGLAQFEAAHPTLTQALDNVLSTLSSSGI